MSKENILENEELQDQQKNNKESVTKNSNDSEHTLSGEDKTNKLEDELQSAKDKYIRLVADFDNFRKRTALQMMETQKNAGEDVIKSLLDVLDDIKMAENQMEKSADVTALAEGVKIIFNKFRNILGAKGLKEMDCKGEEFDSEMHEAISELPAAKEKDSGKIMDVVQAGYYLNDKIIRHAKVVVGK